MTMSYSKYLKEIEKIAKQAISEQEFKDTFEEDQKNFLVHKTALFLRIYGKHIKNSYSVLSNYVPTSDLSQLPFIYYHKRKKKFIVFQNFYPFGVFVGNPDIANTNSRLLEDTSLYVNKWIIDDILERAVRKTPEEARKLWKDQKIAINKLFKRDETSVTKWASRAKIDIPGVSKIEIALKPLELVYIKTPQEIADMYIKGPKSCMDPRSDYAKNWSWLCKKKTGFKHPAEFYAFIPGVSAAYVQGPDRIVARVMLFDDGKTKAQGKIYTDGTKGLAEKVHRQLNLDGWSRQLGDEAWATDQDWEIPGEYVNDVRDYICPLPYTDNVVLPLYVGFDIPKKMFKFSWNSSPDLSPMDLRVNTGYLCAKNVLIQARCHFCSMKIRVGKGVTVKTGEMFCGSECLLAAGFVTAYEADGGPVYARREECIPDAVHSGLFFTTEYAAFKNGCVRFVRNPFVTPIEYIITKNVPYKVVAIEGQLYGISGKLYELAAKKHHPRLKIGQSVPARDWYDRAATAHSLIIEPEQEYVEIPRIDW